MSAGASATEGNLTAPATEADLVLLKSGPDGRRWMSTVGMTAGRRHPIVALEREGGSPGGASFR